MTQANPDNHPPQPPTPPGDGAGGPAPAGGSAAAPDAAARQSQSAAAIQQEIVELQQELDDTRGRMLRIAADYQNYARRAEQNVEEARRQRLIEVARGLVPVLDHFDRAVAVGPTDGGAAGVLEGVRIVREELLKALAKFGIQRVEARPGEPFDPHKHEALMQEAAEGVPAQHVARQLEVGYALGETTIRPVKVAVTP